MFIQAENIIHTSENQHLDCDDKKSVSLTTPGKRGSTYQFSPFYIRPIPFIIGKQGNDQILLYYTFCSRTASRYLRRRGLSSSGSRVLTV